MSEQSAAVLERLLRGNDLGWMIDKYAPKDRAIPFLLEQLEKASTEYRRRIAVDVSFQPEALLAESERCPHKVRAFLQALAISRSPEMLVMVWRILQGLRIHEVTMNYREQEAFRLGVVLACPGGDEDPPYSSDDINDAALVRHFGITTVNGAPLFDGFFPLRKKG
jgi:hypothetical protein